MIQMKRLNLVIAGTAVMIQMEGAIAALHPQLRGIFRGFLEPRALPDARITVSYDHHERSPAFAALPLRISPEDRQTPALRRIAGLYPRDPPLLIGFRNGILAYRVGSRKAVLHLFPSERATLLVGSLLRLLFLFTGIVMVEESRLMLHGAGLKMEPEGALFLGMSGAGKSTVAGRAGRECVLSDDAPVIARTGAAFRIHASPFSQVDLFEEKAADHHRNSAPLTKLVFLRQADRLALEPRDKRSTLAELVRDHIHAFDVMDRELRVRAFELCCALCDSVPGFDLFFRNDDRFLSLFPGHSRGEAQ